MWARLGSDPGSAGVGGSSLVILAQNYCDSEVGVWGPIHWPSAKIPPLPCHWASPQDSRAHFLNVSISHGSWSLH